MSVITFCINKNGFELKYIFGRKVNLVGKWGRGWGGESTFLNDWNKQKSVNLKNDFLILL